MTKNVRIPNTEDESMVLDLRKQAGYLLGEWRLMFRGRSLWNDAVAGAAVALVALPLSLAIARASGVEPQVGLVTAVVGGIVVALFGGCRLQVSGPAAAMTFLVAEIVSKEGVAALIMATLLAGMMQIAAGYFRFGRFMQFIPRPVIAGFLTGIGITIFFTQLPIILGYEVSRREEGGAIGIFWETLIHLREAKLPSLAVGLIAVGGMIYLPKISRKLPAPLIAVTAASLIPWLLGWSTSGDVQLLGALPTPEWKPLPWFPFAMFNEVILAAVTIFFLATIESLLSASVVDSMSKESHVDNDQELIGQGLGNVAAALCGGIPVTGVIARSATNIQAGAVTRLSAIIHAILIVLMMVLLADLVAYIPVAALAGVLIAVAVRMVETHMFKTLWRSGRAEAGVYLVTAGVILFTDLIVGVPVGLVAAFLYFVAEMSRLNVEKVQLAHSHTDIHAGSENAFECPEIKVLNIEGPLFFASIFHLRNILSRLGDCRFLILRMEAVPFLDVTGAELLEEIIEWLAARKVVVLLAEPSASVERKVRNLPEERFEHLRLTPRYAALSEAILHAGAKLPELSLCKRCKKEGRCLAVTTVMDQFTPMQQTPVAQVRAVVTDEAGQFQVTSQVEESPETALASQTPDMPEKSLRPNPVTQWNTRQQRPRIHPTAFVDSASTVIGRVEIAEGVYIAPKVTIRADEGSPFYIGADSNLQDGVTLHALKNKVILHQGRPFAIYIGRGVCCTHHSLVHGPCYLGDGCFVGFKSMVHDAIIGAGCVIGMGAIVIGVTLPPNRYVAHNRVIDTQELADALPEVDARWRKLRDDVVEVNTELASGNRELRTSLELETTKTAASVATAAATTATTAAVTPAPASEVSESESAGA